MQNQQAEVVEHQRDGVGVQASCSAVDEQAARTQVLVHPAQLWHRLFGAEVQAFVEALHALGGIVGQLGNGHVQGLEVVLAQHTLDGRGRPEKVGEIVELIQLFPSSSPVELECRVKE